MEIVKICMFNEKGTIEISLNEYLKLNLMKFDKLLMKIRDSNPELLDKYLEKLGAELNQNITDVPDVTFTMKLEILDDYPDLLEDSKRSIMTFMNFSKYITQPIGGRITMLVSDYLRGYLFFLYKIIRILTTMMPKNKFMEFWKDFVNEYITNNPPEFRTNNLDDLLVEMDQFAKFYQGHDYIPFKLGTGQVGFKITKCLWFEVMKELKDKELCYAIACTGDFQTYKMTNPHCELTRPKTLMRGDKYCDFFLVDIREKKVEHPSEEFWISFDEK